MKTCSSQQVKVPWVKGLRAALGGELYFGEKNLSDYLETHQQAGPCYLLSIGIAQSRAMAMKTVLEENLMAECHLHFAMKSNRHPQLLKALRGLGLGVDVVSFGEGELALANGYHAKSIVFSGVAKSKHEIERALACGFGQLNIESFPELVRITQVAREMRKIAPIAVRVNPEVQVQTHPYIATGFRENKFGVDVADLEEMLCWIGEHPRELQFKGLSLHIGSQLTQFSALEEALGKTLVLESMINRYGLSFDQLDLGGGVGISYSGVEEEDYEYLVSYAQTLARQLRGTSKRLLFEPGRFIVARAGILVGHLQYVKRTPYKNFLIVDVGMNALLRPALYQAYHRILLWPQRVSQLEVFDVVGPVCESSDVLGALREFQSPQEGDAIVIGETGAYGSVLSSQYNLLGEVPELIWEDLR